MRGKRALALILVLALALSLAGCGGSSLYDLLGRALGQGESPGDAHGGQEFSDGPGSPARASGGYFPRDVWRADADYGEMNYEHYDPANFQAVTGPIYALAEDGGAPEDFEGAEYDLYDELYRVYTLYVLISNDSYAHAGDREAADEAAYALEVYMDVYDQFMLALQALARSDHRDLLEDVYSESWMDYFDTFEPSTGQEDRLTREENDLVAQYYALMAETDPDYDRIGEIFVKLVENRNRQAELWGYDTYAAYAYDSLYVKDYTPEDAQAVWQGAKEYFAPVLWEYSGDILDRADELEAGGSLDCSPEAVLEALGAGAEALSPELYEAWEYLTDHGLCDIAPSPEKADVGFTTFLYYYNEPYIFNAASGTFYDYTDLYHEFGHFVNWYYCPGTLVLSMPDNDLSELQAQGMAVLLASVSGQTLGEEAADTLRDSLLLDLAVSVTDGAMYDEFQQRVYAEPDLTPERVQEIFLETYDAYGYSRYEGCEHEWMTISHNFENPFYYISYAVSALGALELNELLTRDFDAGLDRYLRVEAMDPEVYYYSKALEEAELSDIFDRDSYQRAAAALAEALSA